MTLDEAVECAPSFVFASHIGVHNWDNYLPSDSSPVVLAAALSLSLSVEKFSTGVSLDPPSRIPI
jgi:hypothetical protein